MMKVFGRDFKKRHAKRLLGIIVMLILITGTIDFFARDYIPLTGTLYSKTYSTSKHSVTFQAHYSITHNGKRITETISMYESDWDKLVENRSTRQFKISEGKFQSSFRYAWGNISTFLLALISFSAVVLIIGFWLFTDDDGN